MSTLQGSQPSVLCGRYFHLICALLGDTMATIAARPGSDTRIATSLPGRRFDHAFFTSMALLMLATVFAGFARTYFLAGVFRAPLPGLIIHMHGAAFSCWILLLITQTSLVSAGRVDIH